MLDQCYRRPAIKTGHRRAGLIHLIAADHQSKAKIVAGAFAGKGGEQKYIYQSFPPFIAERQRERLAFQS